VSHCARESLGGELAVAERDVCDVRARVLEPALDSGTRGGVRGAPEESRLLAGRDDAPCCARGCAAR